jgi:membrane protease subunit (stomatin/prohibitin family)
MDFMKIITKQLIEIIEWTDDSRDTLSYRWPDEDKEIKNGAQLIVRRSRCSSSPKASSQTCSTRAAIC